MSHLEVWKSLAIQWYASVLVRCRLPIRLQDTALLRAFRIGQRGSRDAGDIQSCTKSQAYPCELELDRVFHRGSAIVLLCLGVGIWTAAIGGEGLDVLDEPQAVPDFELPGIDGRQHRLSNDQDGYTLVNFWAVWCAPCRTEMPSLERLHKKLGGEGLRVIAVHVGPSLEKAARVAEELDLSFAVVVDNDMALTDWGVRGLPTSYLLDPSGRIIAKAVGDREWDSAELIEAIRQMQGMRRPEDNSH